MSSTTSMFPGQIGGSRFGVISLAWRCHLCPSAPKRNHPLVLLSGVGTNAIGFDLSPEASFARHMATQGFDTWIVEVRGAGLSSRINSRSIERQDHALSKQKITIKVDNKQHLRVPTVNGTEAEASTSSDELQFAKLSDSLLLLPGKLSDYLSESQLKVVR